jgi:hypothetical protein
MNIEQLREELETFDKAKLAMLLKQLNVKEETKPKRQKTEHGVVKVYTTVVKKYDCLLCGSHFSAKYKLSKGEETVCLDKEGRVHIVRITGKEGEVEVPCVTNKCQYCEQRVKRWTRQELEDKFIALVNSTTLKEVVTYNVRLLQKGEKEYGEDSCVI